MHAEVWRICLTLAELYNTWIAASLVVEGAMGEQFSTHRRTMQNNHQQDTTGRRHHLDWMIHCMKGKKQQNAEHHNTYSLSTHYPITVTSYERARFQLANNPTVWSQWLVQSNITGLLGDSTGDRWTFIQVTSNAEIVYISWRYRFVKRSYCTGFQALGLRGVYPRWRITFKYCNVSWL